MLWVIKLGGSLHADPILKAWLDLLVEYGCGKVVIVPGGGNYADAVRDAQQRWKFGESIAHRMALLAMEQYALQLQAITPRLIIADTAVGITNSLRSGNVPIWFPSAMVLADPYIRATWGVTSDSLAAWLATHMQATNLVLVKSCPLGTDTSVVELANAGIVDACFADLVCDAKFQVDVISKENLDFVRNGITRSSSD
jgi:5-(aminomethyl)-3-furanmethanol phosphate kinase